MCPQKIAGMEKLYIDTDIQDQTLLFFLTFSHLLAKNLNQTGTLLFWCCDFGDKVLTHSERKIPAPLTTLFMNGP